MFNARKFNRSQVTETLAYEALRAAQIEAERTTKPMKSSAVLAAADAAGAYNMRDDVACYIRAIESLEYSIGVLAAEYTRLRALTGGC